MAIPARQERFIEEYLKDLHETNAAIRAGYSPKTAAQQACRLLKNVKIKAAIDKAKAERSKRTGVSADRVVEEIAKVAFLNPADVIDMDEATIRGEANRDDTACISSVKVKTIPTQDGTITEREVKTYDKLGALKLLGQHLGVFEDNVNLKLKLPVFYDGEKDLED